MRNLAIAILFILILLPNVLAVNYYIATTGNDVNSGAIDSPFRTVTKGIDIMQNGDTLFIRSGTYRLMDEDTTKDYTFNKNGASASNFATIQAYPGENVILLGSMSSTLDAWTQLNSTTWRMDVAYLTRGPRGMFLGTSRIPHKMMVDGGLRMHSNASMLTQNSWTMADVNGYRCQEDPKPTGCYVYYWPPTSEDPNANTYEFSQRPLGRFVTDYTVIRGITFRYTQGQAVFFESADNIVLEENVFSHNSNGNENAYGTGVWYGGGARIRNNTLFDSCYWDAYYGNSHGFAFMMADPANPHIVEYNTITNPCGTAISVKNGVSNLIARYNTITDTNTAIVTSGGRCDWTNSGCVPGDAEYYPGGNWSIYGNRIENSGTGILVSVYSESGVPSNDNKIYNNVFKDNDYAINLQYTAYPGFFTTFANNIFTQNFVGILLDNRGSGTTRTVNDFLPLYTTDNNLFYGNTKDYCNQINWGGSVSGCTGYTLSAMQTTYSRELNSIATDPLFASTTTYTLQANSPAIDAANAAWWNSDLADIGRWPNARNATPPTGICEATSSARCFYIDPVSGNDANNGSFASPWKSAENIKSTIYTSYRAPGYVALAPGDFIYLRGTGNLSTRVCAGGDSGPNTGCNYIIYMRNIQGSAAAPITIASYPGENAAVGNVGTVKTSVPTNLPLDDDYIGGISMQSTSHIVIKDITINNATGVGINVNGGSDLSMRNITIRETARNEFGGNPAGLKFTGVDRTLVENSTFFDNFWEPVPLDNFMRGMGIQYFQGNNHTVRYNTFYQTKQGYKNGVAQGYGECVLYKHAASTATGWFHVYNNTFRNCGGFGAVGLGTQNAHIHHNLIIDSPDKSLHSQNIGGFTYQVNQLWEYNTIINGRALSFSTSMTPYNNLFPGLPKNITFRNNIVYDNVTAYTGERNIVDVSTYGDDTKYAATVPELQLSNNCYYNPNTAPRFALFSANNGGTFGSLGGFYTFAQWQAFTYNSAPLNYDTGSVVANPLFVNAAAGDFRLQAGSPCSAMGAYATSSSTPPPLPQARVGDLNEDGVVNIADVILIIQNFKRKQNYDTGSDINNDGTVNIFDMVLLGRNWGDGTTQTVQPFFQDNFDTGAKLSANGYTWSGPSSTLRVQVTPDNKYSGSHSLRFRYGPDADQVDSSAEQRFNLGRNLTEIWIEYQMWVPTNYFHRLQATVNTPSGFPMNNKFIRLWGDDYNAQNKVGASTWSRYENDGVSNFRWDYVNKAWTSGVGSGGTGSLFGEAGMKGRWNQVRLHFRHTSATDADDGWMQLWLDGALINNWQNVPQKYVVERPYWNQGYLMGWSNSGFLEQTDFYIDDLKFYNQDPGWN